MKTFTLLFSLITLLTTSASAEVILREGLISPEGIKTGVKVTCADENMESSLSDWYADYSALVRNSTDIRDLKVSHTTSASGFVSIKLSGYSTDVTYGLQPAAGCGVSSYLEPVRL